MLGKTPPTSTSRLDRDRRPARASPQTTGASNPEAAVDAERRVGLVQRVEVDAVDIMIEKITALFRRPMQSDLGDGLLIIVVGTSQRPLQ